MLLKQIFKRIHVCCVYDNIMSRLGSLLKWALKKFKAKVLQHRTQVCTHCMYIHRYILGKVLAISIVFYCHIESLSIPYLQHLLLLMIYASRL